MESLAGDGTRSGTALGTVCGLDLQILCIKRECLAVTYAYYQACNTLRHVACGMWQHCSRPDWTLTRLVNWEREIANEIASLLHVLGSLSAN